MTGVFGDLRYTESVVGVRKGHNYYSDSDSEYIIGPRGQLTVQSVLSIATT